MLSGIFVSQFIGLDEGAIEQETHRGNPLVPLCIVHHGSFGEAKQLSCIFQRTQCQAGQFAIAESGSRYGVYRILGPGCELGGIPPKL